MERHFIEELVNNASFKSGNYENALTETFLRMDELLQTPEGKKELAAIKSGDDDSRGEYQTESFAGCTANVALIVKNELYVANSGDSRCIIYNGDQAFAMSEDHKPELEHERARIQKAGGFITDGRINGNLNLSRAIGDLEYKRNTDLKPGEQLISVVPDVKKRTITAEDELLVLGCDGIWECLTNQQIAEFLHDKIKEGKSVLKAAEDLLDNIVAPDTSSNIFSFVLYLLIPTLAGIGCDNMTVIVLALK